MRTRAFMLLLCVLAACAPEDAAPDRGEARAQQSSKADGPDQCAGVFYGDGDFCDCWCPNPDPDCDAGLPLWQECEAPPAECSDTQPCATCAGLDCPVMTCVQGQCVQVVAAECSETQPCASCAGLECPVMDCIDGHCVARSASCSASQPCASCAGLDCPAMACVDGSCVEARAVECSESQPCASCAGLDCPTMDCLDGRCMAVDSSTCPDPSDPDIRYHGFTPDECAGPILCSNNEAPFDIDGCGCGCEFLL